MSTTKKVITTVIILAGLFGAGFAANKMGWFDTAKTTTITTPVKPDTQLAVEKAAREKAEAELKKMKDQKAADEKKIAEAIESIDRMQKMIADMNQPPADQIATPVAPATPADTATVVPVQKKKSGVGG